MLNRIKREFDPAAYIPKTLICLREGYTRQTFVKDLFAGVTVGIVALPLAMAFAIASGVTPDKGLYTAIVAGFLISLLGGSRVQIGGPTGAFVVIIYGIVQQYGYNGLAMATVMAGVLLVLMGLARFGAVLKFIPYPVTTGFTTGIALIIFSSQVKDFLGLQMDAPPADFFAKWWAYLRALPSWNPYAVILSLGCLFLLLRLRRTAPRVPAAILVVVLSAVAVKIFHLPVETIGTKFGAIPRTLPMPAWPAFEWEKIPLLVPQAFTIALLAAIESLLSAVVADGMMGTRHKANCELVAQGLANIGSIIFGGIPATGAIARTATNIKSGARTPVAGMIHALVLLLCMYLFAPMASRIPLAALAAILVLIAWNMSEFDHFIHMFRSPKSDVLVMLSVFGITVIIDLTMAVQVGVVMAAILFMKRMSDVTEIGGVSLSDEDEMDDMALQAGDKDATSKKKIPPGTEVYEINGPFFFGVADRLKNVLSQIEKPPKVFILRMRHVPFMDATGANALDEFFNRCRRQGTALVLSGVQPQPRAVLENSGLANSFGRQNVTDHIDKALKRAEELLA